MLRERDGDTHGVDTRIEPAFAEQQDIPFLRSIDRCINNFRNAGDRKSSRLINSRHVWRNVRSGHKMLSVANAMLRHLRMHRSGQQTEACQVEAITIGGESPPDHHIYS